LSQQLQSGQSVEVITSEEARPSPDWLTFAVSGKARAAIRQSLKSKQRTESIALGRKLLNRSLANVGSSINDLDFRRLRRVFKEFGVRKLDEVLQAIGNGDVMSYVVAQRLLSADDRDYEPIPVEHAGPVAVREGEGLVITYGRCCGPVPGDSIVGHMTPGKGFVVHIESCNNMTEIRRRSPEQIIPARWTAPSDAEFTTTLRIDVNRKKGVIAELAATIADVDAGVDRINVEERDARVSSVVVVVSVQNRNHLARVMRRLRAIPNVLRMGRVSA
jgi:(p)ppGpp synthase/HD superfamily hydrolase